jgi:zinc transporter 5/7
LVNLVGLFFFHDHHDHGDHDHSHSHGDHHHHDHDNENMYGVFLHVLADCLGSVGVIMSSVLVKYYDMYVADPICSFIISLMILASSIPFIQNTASHLILQTPLKIKKRYTKIQTKIEAVESV